MRNSEEIEENTAANTHTAIRTLAADDDRTIRMLLQAQLKEIGHEVTMAKDGKEAWDLLQDPSNVYDVVLLDREMPGMNGLDVVRKMKMDPQLKRIPVIMQTGSGKPEQMKEGIDAGVFYYLTKPYDSTVLRSVLTAAARDTQQQQVLGKELQQHRASFNLIQECSLVYSTLSEAESLACFIANCYQNPEKMVSGLAALLINAVEHGNLGVGYDEKTWMMKASNWREEITRLQNLPENKNKYVEIKLRKKQDGIYIQITDKGQGFEWQKYMQIDPSRAQDNHGRGIAQANAVSFDSITYNDKGNEVVAYVSNDAEIEW
jgi:CheY-like chemotaxis protein